MPLYVFACPICDVVLEELRPVDLADWPPVECPVCHGLCQREIALVNLHFDRASNDATGSPVSANATHDLNDGEQSNAIHLLHDPGCPCCNGRRRVS